MNLKDVTCSIHQSNSSSFIPFQVIKDQGESARLARTKIFVMRMTHFIKKNHAY